MQWNILVNAENNRLFDSNEGRMEKPESGIRNRSRKRKRNRNRNRNLNWDQTGKHWNRSALDSTHQNHIDREGLRLSFE